MNTHCTGEFLTGHYTNDHLMQTTMHTHESFGTLCYTKVTVNTCFKHITTVEIHVM